MRKRSLEDIIKEINVPGPEIGGGGVACITAAFACGLDVMALGITANRRKAEEIPYAEILHNAQERFLQLGEADGKSFDGVLQALKMDKSDPKRKEALRAGYEKALAVPFEAYRLAVAIFELQPEIYGKVDKVVNSDVKTAFFLLDAALESLYLVVAMNGKKVDPMPDLMKEREKHQETYEKMCVLLGERSRKGA